MPIFQRHFFSKFLQIFREKKWRGGRVPRMTCILVSLILGNILYNAIIQVQIIPRRNIQIKLLQTQQHKYRTCLHIT